MPPPQATLRDQARAHHQAGRFAEADALYRQLLAADPRDAEALGLLGLLAVQAGQHEAGLALIDRALALRPNAADLRGHRGLALKALGRAAEAVEEFKAALRARPGDFGLLYNLGNAQREAGQLDHAAASLRRAIRRNPAIADAHNNLGATLRQQGRPQEAADSFRHAIALAPHAAPLHVNLGAALAEAGQTEAARRALTEATSLDPSNPEAWHLLGQVLNLAGHYAAAAEAYDQALRRAETPALHTDRAGVLARIGDRAAALVHLRRAVALAPQDPQALTNLGSLLRDLDDDAGAIDALDRALALRPLYPPARYHLGLLHLRAGRLDQGWPLYEARLEAMTGARARFAEPIWRGEPMPGQTLLLHAEQGLGDTLEFCRFVPAAARAAGARVVLEVQPALLRLLASLPGVDQILPAGAQLPPFAKHCPLPSLPFALNITLADLPGPVPYLSADPARVAHWAARLAAAPGRKIGLTWAGNPEGAHDELRSLPADALAALDDLPGVSFVSLQKDRGRLPDGAMPRPIDHDWTEELTDLAETAALIGALDLVISADTAIVHLAGALGGPVWLLNRKETDWRWFRDRPDDSPWYPTLRQFRQQTSNDWTGVLASVRAALR